jgi:hypothetical protein
MSPINSLARVMGNANRFTINCQGETAPGRQAALDTFRNRLMHTGKRTASTVEVTGHRCQVTGKTASKGTLLPVTCYLLPVTCYLLPVTCYLLPVTCYLLPVTCGLLASLAAGCRLLFTGKAPTCGKRQKGGQNECKQQIRRNPLPSRLCSDLL